MNKMSNWIEAVGAVFHNLLWSCFPDVFECYIGSVVLLRKSVMPGERRQCSLYGVRLQGIFLNYT